MDFSKHSVEGIKEESRDDIPKKSFAQGSKHEGDYFTLKKDNQNQQLSHHILDYKGEDDQSCDQLKDIIADYRVNYHEQKEIERNITHELLATRSQMQIYMEEIKNNYEEIESLKQYHSTHMKRVQRLHDVIQILQCECYQLLPTNTQTWLCKFCQQDISIHLVTWHLVTCSQVLT